MPVFEALRLAWDRIQPCEVVMLAMNQEAGKWYWTLPGPVREQCRVHDRIPRCEVLALMQRARVMLAPSLVDGTPNSLFEAMACGALPIVSPLDTITPIVRHEENVLFARNLYPQEIAESLCRAMADDTLVARCTSRNVKLVKTLADRSTIRIRVIDYYHSLV